MLLNPGKLYEVNHPSQPDNKKRAMFVEYSTKKDSSGIGVWQVLNFVDATDGRIFDILYNENSPFAQNMGKYIKELSK